MLMIWVLHGQAGPPLCMDRPSSLFLWFFCQVVCHALRSETHCTIPTSALVFGGNIFTHPCFLTFYGMQISDGQRLVYLKGFQTTVATKESMCPKYMAGLGCVAHCGMWLGGQPKVSCGGGCKMRYFCLDRLPCCRVSCDKARTAEQGGGAVAPNNSLLQEIMVIGKARSRSSTHNPNHISLLL